MIDHSPFCPVSVGYSAAPECVCKGGKAEAAARRYQEIVAAGERSKREAQAVLASMNLNRTVVLW